MTCHFSEQVLSSIRDLVWNVTKFSPDTELFKTCDKYATTVLESADSMVFFNKREMDSTVTNLSEKFIFHGFLVQAEDLMEFYRHYIPEGLPKTELNNRLNAIQFLITICERPTDHLLRDPFGYKRKVETKEIIDWPAYLNEGLGKWSPPLDEIDSDQWSEDENLRSFFNEKEKRINTFDFQSDLTPLQITHPEVYEDYSNARDFLKQNVQNTWFYSNYICMVKSKTHLETKIGVKWEDFVENESHGLLSRNSVLTEYVIMREVIWQFFSPTSACVYKMDDSQLVPRFDATISSIRQPTFKTLLEWFVPYCSLLQEFRIFFDNIYKYDNKEVLEIFPNTYHNYIGGCEENVIYPIEKGLVAMEHNLVKQEKTMTLLNMACAIKRLFKPALVLKEIHANVILDFHQNTYLKCATNLIVKLRMCLVHSTSKLEQDLCLTLYLKSLYKYFHIIDSWLKNGKWSDINEEFVISDCRPISHENWDQQYKIRQLDDFVKADPLINIICTDVLNMGKNINFLHSLKEYSLMKSHSESLNEEFRRKFLEEVTWYFNKNSSSFADDNSDDKNYTSTYPPESLYKFPSTCPDDCKSPTVMDMIDNVVDTTDGFCIAAFKRYLLVPPKKEMLQQKTLYETISGITKSLFPADKFLVNVFSKVLQERYGHYGVLVNDLLINGYKLREHLELLQRIFLFKDDIIFPCYRRLFELINSSSNRRNNIFMTSHLQDVLIDYHPTLFDKCSLYIKDNWKECKDPIKACYVNMHFHIEWPINIIVKIDQLKMYQDIFHFILMIKWALYILNHLYFSDLQQMKGTKGARKSYKNIVQRLKLLRFFLLNHFATIQHFYLGNICNKFNSDFKKKLTESLNLDGLITAHEEYLKSVHKTCVEIRDYNTVDHGFHTLMYLVWKLQTMWMDIVAVDDQDLENCERDCKVSYTNLENIISPQLYHLENLEDTY